MDIGRAFEDPPAIVCLELDRNRLHGLLHPKEKTAGFFELSRHVGMRGALFAVVAKWVQQHFGKQVGIEPGAEMLFTFKKAKGIKAKIALIDQPIEVTLRNFSKEFTGKEKLRLVWDIISSPFSKGESITFDLSKVPKNELIVRMLEKLKERYPSMYKVLLEDRNIYMALRLRLLMVSEPNKRILAIMGAGHVEGVLKILKAHESVISHTWSVEHQG